MASLIEGYSYDIFISYRQKDNKYDGWVTEFVDHLKKELEATFKEDISVYFDINPHDGLLETHDVDASLKEKLKCFVFIPIISRTYCDPKSFAWVHEFKAFIEQASKDQYGLKVKLPGGNVTNRVLLVQIHDLDEHDIKECESVLGGFLRGVEFIYKSPGVNRPLRAKEENPYDNLNHTIYRDQINKVALAIKDIVESMKSGPSEKKSEKKAKITRNDQVTDELSEKAEDNNNLKESSKQDKKIILFRKGILIPVIIVFLAICIISAILLNHRQKVIWAKENALPEVERLFNESKIPAAFNLLQKAGKLVPGDPRFKDLALRVTRKFTILTDPLGVDVYIREYSDNNAEWMKIGKTPIESIILPSMTFYIVKLQKEGYEDVMAVTTTSHDTLSRKLFKVGTIPQNMVYVDGYWDEWKNTFEKESVFFIDRYEVTNRQFKEFVDKGGYSDSRFWKNEFVKKGKKLSWEEAMTAFIDKTGKSGPSTWEEGTYPQGQDNYPVSGVCWYEAAAYAEFAGKSLPTADHWDSGAGFYDTPYNKIGSTISPFSNFSNKGAEPVENNRAITAYGAYDMPGNVREWCWNESGLGHIIAGGSWSDSYKSFTSWSNLPSFDRSPENGFRCIKYLDIGAIPKSAFRFIEMLGGRDYSKEIPVPYNTFLVYKKQFLYDEMPLLAIIEERNDSLEYWTIEKVSFKAAYDDERIIAYLFLPKKFLPPFQTLIYFPGSPAIYLKDLKESEYVKWFGEFILKSGRAVLFPIYKGTFERNDGLTLEMSLPNHSREYKEWLIKWVKDFSRSIDYLETRSDIDKNKIGFYGISWGGILGGIIPAVEKRLAVNIMLVGGFGGTHEYPEADAINYVSRITIPTLMLNGKKDSRFPLETAVLPFWNLLGTLEKDKRLCVYENPTDHFIPEKNVITEMLNFLDKYFGPVVYQLNN
jgi:dienelactone hydrolase